MNVNEANKHVILLDEANNGETVRKFGKKNKINKKPIVNTKTKNKEKKHTIKGFLFFLVILLSISFFLVTFFVAYFLHEIDKKKKYIKSLEKTKSDLEKKLSNYRVDSTITNSVIEEHKKNRDIFKKKYEACQMENEKLKIKIKDLENKRKEEEKKGEEKEIKLKEEEKRREKAE